MHRLFLVVATLGVIGCSDRPAPAAEPPAGATPDIARTTFAPSLGVDLKAMSQTPSGVWIRDLMVGTGEEATAGKEVAVHYTGTLTDGTQFDANGPSDAPMTFQIAAGGMIPGFDEGVKGMRVGGKRQIIFPPALGYGAQANGPIPANSILVFTIELVSAR